MPRRARLTLPQLPLRLIQRGDDRQAGCYAENDYRFYLDGLDEYAGSAERRGCIPMC